jgi:hypothetical protein
MRAHSEIETHDPRRTRWVLFPCATTSYTENMLIYCIYTGYSYTVRFMISKYVHHCTRPRVQYQRSRIYSLIQYLQYITA